MFVRSSTNLGKNVSLYSSPYDISACLPDFLNRFSPASRFSVTVLVADSALQILEIAFPVRFGPRFFIPCFTTLLLCSMSRSNRIFVTHMLALLMERFQTNLSLSLGDSNAIVVNNWCRHSSAYFELWESALQYNIRYLYSLISLALSPSPYGIEKI